MSDLLSDFVSLDIRRDSRTPTAAGFGVMLLLCYTTLVAARTKTYADLDEITADGFVPEDAFYQMASAAFSQDPRPQSVVLGRRASPFTQVVEIGTPSSPAASTAHAVKVDGLTASYTTDGTPTRGELCTGLAAAINALGDVDAIVATGASATGSQVLSGSALDGVSGANALPLARKLTLTLSSHADWDATTATIAGYDSLGNAISESLSIPNGGNATLTTTRRFRRVLSVSIPAQSGTGGTFTVGVAAPVTADGTSATKVVCTSAAGELHSFESLHTSLTLTTTTTDPGVSAELDACASASSTWYAINLDSQGSAEVLAAAAWAEAQKRLLLVDVSDAGVADGSATSDVAYSLKALAYTRTLSVFSSVIGGPTYRRAAAIGGKELPKAPGSSVVAFKTLAGQAVDDLSSAQREALAVKNVATYITVGGVNIVVDGKTASGEWFDVVRDLDALTAWIKESVFGGFIADDKIPFTDDGISRVVGLIRAPLQRGVGAGILAASPAPQVFAPRASAVSTADKRARALTGITFTATLAGAVQAVQIKGRVTV